LTVTIALL